MVEAANLVHERGCGAVHRVWHIIAGGAAFDVAHTLPTIAGTIRDLAMQHQVVICQRVGRPAITSQHNTTGALFRVVARDAMPIENGLDVAWEIDHIRHSGNRLDRTRAALQCRQARSGWRRLGAGLVAAEAAALLAGLERHEAAHLFD